METKHTRVDYYVKLRWGLVITFSAFVFRILENKRQVKRALFLETP